MTVTPSASYSLTLRVKLENEPGMLGEVTSAIGRAGGQIGAIDIVEAGDHWLVRDISVDARDQRALGRHHRGGQGGRRASSCSSATDRTFRMHLGGKIAQRNKHPLKTRDDLSMAYTPGVARVCLAIARGPREGLPLHDQAELRRRRHATAPRCWGWATSAREAAMPVMEGKAMLLQGVRRRGRLPDLPRHHRPGRDRRTR